MHSDGLTLEVRGDMLEHRSFRIDNIIEDYNKNEYELAERIVELENESFKYCTDRNQLRLIVQERKEKIEMLIDENKKYLKVISELENNISTFNNRRIKIRLISFVDKIFLKLGYKRNVWMKRKAMKRLSKKVLDLSKILNKEDK